MNEEAVADRAKAEWSAGFKILWGMSHLAWQARRVDMSIPPEEVHQRNPDVVVVGAGLAGLAAAALVARAGKSVVVHEKLGTVGGQARSTRRDGFTFNQGPHALYRGGPAERVLNGLGVTIKGGQPPVKGQMVFDGKGEIAPGGLLTLLQTRALGAKDKVEVAKTLARLPKLRAADFATVSANDWVSDVVARERPTQMLHALIRLATYSHEPAQLSADLAITQLQGAIDGDGVLYLHHGWQTLVDQLRNKAGGHITTGEGIETVPEAPAVIVAVGGPAATAKILGTTFDVGPAATASCLDLGLRRNPEVDFVLGGDEPFYFSNHSAVADLAPAGYYHAAAVQYLADGDEPDAAKLASFAEHAGVSTDDIVTSRRLHRMTTVTAIPTARRGGVAGRPAITASGYDNVFIAGDWVGPEGHLADASLASAEAAAMAALRHLSQRQVKV